MKFYFIVENGIITSIVQRNTAPQNSKDVHFYKADSVTLGLYQSIKKQKDVVTLQEVLDLKR